MPKAEVGSTKYVANKMKAKGLQRLRWYCQICEKQCRDENGFKQHTMSEGHVRAMLLIGEDPKKFINDYSNQFKRDFLHLLKTAHGEKKVHMNNFYQEYIRDKEHVHMNSTKWPSLTEFAKYLGREGVCRVEEGDRGLDIQWVDDSAQAIERREDVKKKERLAKGDEDMESRLLEQQIKKAKEAAERSGRAQQQPPKDILGDANAEPVKVSLSLGSKAAPKQATTPQELAADAPVHIESFSAADIMSKPEQNTGKKASAPADDDEEDAEDPKPSAPARKATQSEAQPSAKVSLSLSGGKPKHSNPLMKRNPLSKKKDSAVAAPEKKMSNAERIMKDEMERKRVGEQRGYGGAKRPKLG
ncbi:hypothetical protein LTR36_005941 [Oleoguttula mirabilis]|uniref:DNA/RNA-binding protein Kin17 WH-like domain-containing protein n=1 Tax=Oleoguttula mirabilis TaxID=1507867 RepID=A0AAV9JDC3_9PEZI|nr:hypothetical protein LTR36_005941 [Oleoguttula mirabilis]